MTAHLPVLVGVVGLGKAGCAWVRSLHAVGISVVASSSNEKSQALMRPFLSQDAFTDTTSLASFLASVDGAMLLLAVPDDSLVDVGESLAAMDALPAKVVHCCGSQGMDALHAPYRMHPKTAIGVVHPMAALQKEMPIPQGTLLAVEASSDELSEELLALATKMRCICSKRKSGKHVAYHCGAVVAGNLAVALLAHGVLLLQEAGVDEEMARKGLAQLLRSTADAALEKPLSAALTGPVARGDGKTIAAHLDVLSSHPSLEAMYRALSLTLCDVVDDGGVSTEQDALRKILTRE